MLRDAVESVFAQSWRPIEIIIVDDGSTDGTANVAHAIAVAHPEIVKVVHTVNGGPAQARQEGLKYASGEFIQYLDSDDLLLPNKFSLQVDALRANPRADISYGKTYVSEDGVRSLSPAQHTGERYEVLFPALLKEPLWPTLTPLYRRSVIEAIGPWPNKRQLEDWEYDAQAGALGLRLHYCDEFIAETRNHSQQRLCHLWMNDRAAMRDRILAYVSVHRHALIADVAKNSAEMQQFARSLLWMARVAGLHGFTSEAWQLFALARATTNRPGIEYVAYSLTARTVGWKVIGKMAAIVEKWRPR